MRTRSLVLGGLLAVTALVFAPPAQAADQTLRVTASGQHGWTFNPDSNFDTPFHFSGAEASIGAGSLFVEPITNSNNTPGSRDKFIGSLALGIPTSDVEAISYDFLIAGSATAADANEFYLNVYTAMPGSSETFYDCRFDYVPATGSTAAFTTATFTSATPATDVRSRNGSVCPATLGAMPPGSTVLAMVINVGDTSNNDTGVGGYYDRVVLDTTAGTTTYDFDVDPTSKDQCKKGGHSAYGFSNQGQCVRFVQTGKDSR